MNLFRLGVEAADRFGWNRIVDVVNFYWATPEREELPAEPGSVF